MKKKLIVQAVVTATAICASAQINSTTADGYMLRGEKMYTDNNYAGCIDQLSHIDRSALSDDEREQVDWLLAQSAYHTIGVDAVNHFRLYLAQYPYSIRREEAKMRIGDCLYRSNYAEALKAYNHVDPDCLTGDLRETLAYRTAYCYMQLGQYDEATRRFEALSSNKTYGNASRFYLGYIAYNQGDYAKAKQLFKTVNTDTEPGNMADYYLAQIYFIDGDYNKALQTSRRLLMRSDIEPEFTAEANHIAGESLYQLNNTAEAIPYLRKYVAATETPARSALYILGLSEYRNGEYSEAVKSLQPVTEGDDAMAQSAYLYIGQALYRQGDNDAALLAFDKSLRMKYDTDVEAAAFYNYAVAKSEGGKIPFGSSVSTFEEFLRRFPDSKYAPDVEEYIVTGYLTDNNYGKALSAINEMKSPTEKVLKAKQHILYTLGARNLAAGNASDAVNYLKQARTLSQYDATTAAETELVLGEALYRTGNYSDAATALNNYLTSGNTNADNVAVARYDLGYTRMAQKQYDNAATNFKSLIANPGSLDNDVIADAYNRLGDCCYYTSDFSKAAEYYDKSYSLNPAAGDYSLFQKGVMKGYTRNHKAKIEDLKKLQVEYPASTLIPDALLEMTESYIQLGDNASAIKTYRQLVSQYPNTEQGRKGYLQMALTLINNGQKSEAVAAYKEIISRYPTSDEASQAADALKRIYAAEGTLDQYASFINGIENAPKLDVSEAEQLTYDAAEKSYVTEGSTTLMKKYLQQYPEGTHAVYALNYLMQDAANKGNTSEADSYATQLIDRYPDNRLTENALIVKANNLYAAGKGELALETWKRLERQSSSSQNTNTARVGIMRVARDLGDYSTVIEAADALLASSTLGSEDKNEATFSRALALDNTGKTAEARKLWKSIADNTDDLYGAKSAYYYSESLYNAKDYTNAQKSVETFINSGTPHSYWLARGFILLSDIYTAKGQSFEAREYLEALRENYPGKESDIFMMIDSRLNK
jgi:TolA-binding protein